MSGTDQTARILAEHGTATARAEYAIHEAHARYREATGADRNPSPDPAVWDRARRARRDELTDALMAYDSERGPDERETWTIGHARDVVGAYPLTEFDHWCRSVLVTPAAPAEAPAA